MTARDPRTCSGTEHALALPESARRLPWLALLMAVIFAAGPVPAQTQGSATNRVVLRAGAEWVALQPELEIEPGSPLDFSGIGQTDAPAGEHGRVVAGAGGQFCFEDSPTRARRFYGVNLCFSAQYLSKEQADKLADRLARLGYNAVRFHHYEQELTSGQPTSTTLNPERLDQLDYLAAALIRRGIYLTTDLFVSRAVPYREVGIDKPGLIPMDTFKILVPVHEGAFENWKKFSRALLSHLNPYTRRKYSEEPALAWLALINEGNFGNFFKDIQTIPEWQQAWNRWLARRYPSRAALADAWGRELSEGEDSAQQNVALPQRLQADGPRARDCIEFLADTEKDMVQRMKTFLRDELGCRALVSNSSSWTRFTTDQGTRTVYDYVDDHFYVDHPQFLQGSWRLPSRCPNTSPLAEGAPGGRNICFTRLFDKPFTVTEYNYSAPGQFRGVGGILTGALGALQGWGGIWRFAYCHSREAEFSPAPMGYFDVASDPLSQAAERASLCLFLRGDLQTAPHRVALTMTTADLAKPGARIPTLAPKWHWLTWVTRVGSEVLPAPAQAPADAILAPVGWSTPREAYPAGQTLSADPYLAENGSLVSVLSGRGLFEAAQKPDPARRYFRSETGEVTIDGPRDRLVLDTARTAGGYAPVGEIIDAAKGGVRVQVQGAAATVWVSALDDQPIRTSRRLLVTHLTDLQNTGIEYGEAARQTLYNWGQLPYLVRVGQAELRVRLDSPGRYQVWALSCGGKRLLQVHAEPDGNALHFKLDVGGDPGSGARMLYEVVRNP